MHFDLEIAGERLLVISPRAGVERRGLSLLLHGWAISDPRAYADLIDVLTTSGHRVAFPLYQPSNFITDYKRDIRRIMDAGLPGWRQELTLLVGHSAGATVAADLFVEEAGGIAPSRMVLLCAGDGSGPGGERPPPPFRLRWGSILAAEAVLPARRPRVLIVSASDDRQSGAWVSDRLEEYLRGLDTEIPITREVLSPEEGGATAGHFFPLGGSEDYQLPPLVRAVGKTDAYGGRGAGWRQGGAVAAFFKRLRGWIAEPGLEDEGGRPS
jgi:pimeloyl-ACP methyl ester carboxylesterase